MPVFTYKAIDALGKPVAGQMDAINLIDLELRLKRMELDFINGREARKGASRGATIKRRDLITFCFHMEQLNKAGVPIIEGLIDLRDTMDNPRFREVLSSMIESIQGGKRLSESMDEHPRIFSTVFVSLIRAGEETGRLPEVLAKLAETLKWEDELAAHTRKIVMYPAFVGSIVFGVTCFLMIYMVPQMTSFIKNMGKEIPMQTQILLAVSYVFVHYWYLLIGVPLVAVITILMLARTNPKVSLKIDEIKLNIPFIGIILRKIILSRFASIFAMMYSSGITILDSIKSCEQIVGNRIIAAALVRVGQRINDGLNVTAAFEQEGLFPPLVLRMLRVGEGTGSLDTALLNVSYFYNRDVKESIERVQVMIEPAMTLVLGLLLGWVMMAVLGPIYDVISKLKI